MNRFMRPMLGRWRMSPVRITLTALSMALGTGIFVIAFSAGAISRNQLITSVAQTGAIFYVANATWNPDGSLERVMPDDWDAAAPEKVASESGVVKAAALVSDAPFDQLTAGTRTHRLGSAIGTTPGYFGVFSLRPVAGDAMLASDVDQGSKKAWISEDLATALFGSAKDALGRRVEPQGRMFRRAPVTNALAIETSYSVAGVYSTPNEIARKSYGIADLVLPYTALPTPDMSQTIERRSMPRTFVVRSSASSAAKAEAAIGSVLEGDYPRSDGKPLSVAVWEGSPRGASTYLKQLRRSIGLFAASVEILGLAFMVISSLGVFSVMVVEIQARRRELALERAIGASRFRVVREFWTWSAALSLIGAMIGILISLALAAPVMRTIAPLAGEVSDQFRAAAGLTPASIVGGFAMALGCGGTLGALPAIAAIRGNIGYALREL